MSCRIGIPNLRWRESLEPFGIVHFCFGTVLVGDLIVMLLSPGQPIVSKSFNAIMLSRTSSCAGDNARYFAFIA